MSLKPWEEQKAFIEAQYESAVARQDPDAPISELITVAETEEKKSQLISIQTINKHMVFVMKKALSTAAKSLGISFGVDPVIDFLVSIQGLEMPPTGEAIIIKKLDVVLEKLKELKDQQQQIVSQLSNEMKLLEVSKVCLFVSVTLYVVSLLVSRSMFFVVIHWLTRSYQ
jgi:hypothetical protein